MELIQRYLQAVKFWLPKDQKEDIIAEIADELHAQVEEREAALGRTLRSDESEEIVRRYGQPLFVANRYLPQEQLIGPALFPLYKFVLKVMLLCYPVPAIVLGILMALFSPEMQVTARKIVEMAWTSVFAATGVITLAFVVVERIEARTHFLTNWDPKRLPPLRDPLMIPRSASAFELLFNAIFVVWWALYLSAVRTVDLPSLHLTLSPLWPWFFWGFLLVGVANLVSAAQNLLHPWWSVGRAAARLITDAAGSILFCALIKGNVLIEIVAPSLTPQRSAEITAAINMWMTRMFPVAVLLCLVVAAVNVSRIWRARSAGPGRKPVAAAMAI